VCPQTQVGKVKEKCVAEQEKGKANKVPFGGELEKAKFRNPFLGNNNKLK